MFTFKPYDDCEHELRSKDTVYEELKKDFHFSVYYQGLEEANNRVFVRMNSDCIQFFLGSNPSNVGTNKMIESISLTNPKDTGNDLLYFAEDIKKYDLFKEQSVQEKLPEYLRTAKEIFCGFPFFHNDKYYCGKQKEKGNFDQIFLRLCLLEFLLAVDTHDEIFAIAPNYDEIRTKLRQSKVYLLLCAKLRCCMYLYKNREALNAEEYSFVVAKYSDLLMDEDYNKIVPPSYYDSPRFLDNPECELRQIARRNDAKNLIREATQEKITAFFLTKHATLECGFGKLQRWLKVLRILLMLVMVFWMLLSLMWFDIPQIGPIKLTFFFPKLTYVFDVQNSATLSFLTSCTDAFFETYLFGYFLLIWLLLSMLIFILPTAKGEKQRRRVKVKLFHSRIVVALLMGWFTIAVSEDLIKSQLELGRNMVWWMVAAVLTIVFLMLWGEVRQHSPYYCRFRSGNNRVKNWPKVSVVLVYAMFWNLLMGILMQGITYSSLLRTSGAMPDAILGQLPAKVNIYKESIESCINMLDDYDNSMEGIIHDYGKVQMYGEAKASSVDTTLTLTTSVNPTKKTGNTGVDFVKIHNSYFNQISHSLELIEDNCGIKMSCRDHDSVVIRDLADSTCYLVKRINDSMTVSAMTIRGYSLEGHDLVFEPVFAMMNDSLPSGNSLDDTRVRIEKNLEKTREIKNGLRIELLGIDRFLQDVSADERMKSLARYSSNENNDAFYSDNYYLAFLAYKETKKHKFCRSFALLGNADLFPRMLVFHSLIVIVIAFVGQLIVSDKSVTEPL